MKIKKWILLSIFMVLFLACVAILITGLIPGNDLSDNFYDEKQWKNIYPDGNVPADRVGLFDAFDERFEGTKGRIVGFSQFLNELIDTGKIKAGESFKNYTNTDRIIEFIDILGKEHRTLLQTYRIAFGVGMSLLATTFLGLMLWRFKKIYKISIVKQIK